jgi:hypothetical protein
MKRIHPGDEVPESSPSTLRREVERNSHDASYFSLFPTSSANLYLSALSYQFSRSPQPQDGLKQHSRSTQRAVITFEIK